MQSLRYAARPKSRNAAAGLNLPPVNTVHGPSSRNRVYAVWSKSQMFARLTPELGPPHQPKHQADSGPKNLVSDLTSLHSGGY
jgi:hypothetical protein